MTGEFVTVSAIGASSGLLPNDGANFGPDTAATTTSGIQEALNSIASTGGIVFCRKGNYNLTSPIWNTGNFQTVVFEAGSTIGLTGTGTNYTNWNGDVADIWVGCNFVKTAGGTGTATYHDVAWFGNGTTITATGYTGGNGGEQVFAVLAYLQSGLPAPSYNVVIDGFAANGWTGAALILANNSLAAGATYPQQWRRVRIRRYVATMSSSAIAGSGFIVSGCNGLEVEDVVIDCSAATVALSNCFVTSQRGGDTQSAIFRRCYFKNNGTSGNCLDAQGSTASRGNTHDIVFEDCLFDSGATSGNPGAGGGGAYVDDSSGASSTSRVFNIEFRRCQWLHCGMTFQSAGAQSGYVLFDGAEPGSFASSLQGRPVSLGPILPSVYASGLRFALPRTTPSTIASYSATTVGQFRVTIYVTAKAADTPTIQVTWHDPDTGSQTASPITSALALNGVATAVLDLVADATAAIVVKGSALGSATSLVASATVDQVQ